MLQWTGKPFEPVLEVLMVPIGELSSDTRLAVLRPGEESLEPILAPRALGCRKEGNRY